MPPKLKDTDPRREPILAYYKEGHTINQCAVKYHIYNKIIGRWLRNANLTRLPAHLIGVFEKNSPRYGIWGELHPRYKGGYINKDGYKVIRINTKEKLEHRYVMEKNLGRKLHINEVVHHINNNKIDNLLENLELTNHATHAKIHWSLRTQKGENTKCLQKMS